MNVTAVPSGERFSDNSDLEEKLVDSEMPAAAASAVTLIGLPTGTPYVVSWSR